MVESPFFAALVAAALGFLSGLGVGGGSLLILYLTLCLGIEQSAAQGINLLFFIPAAIIYGVMHWKKGALSLKKLWPALAAGIPAAILCAWLSTSLDTTLARKLFGGLLILTGIYELTAKKRQ